MEHFGLHLLRQQVSPWLLYLLGHVCVFDMYDYGRMRVIDGGVRSNKLTHVSLVAHCQNGKPYKWTGTVLSEAPMVLIPYLILLSITSCQIDPSNDQQIEHATGGPMGAHLTHATLTLRMCL